MKTATETRRRVRLTQVRTIAVTGTGARAAEGPMTLGQINIFGWLNRVPGAFYGILCVELPVPPGVSVDDVAESMAILVARHESLRTTCVDGDPPWQRIAATGVIPLEVCSLGEGQWGPRDRPAVAGALVRWLRESPAPEQASARIVVATAPGTDRPVVACAAGFSHLAVDHGAIEVIRREFADMLRDPSLRHVGEPRHQPLDQADIEASPAGQRRAARALSYLAEQSRRMPRCLYALPDARAGGEQVAVELLSVAAAMAVRRVAARTRASRSSVVVAAICAVLARRVGYRALVLPLSSNNRFERHLIDYVGPLAQGCVATVDVGDDGFDALVTHTWRRVLEASRHCCYDATKRTESDRRIEYERGVIFNHDLLFNSLVAESWSGFTAGVGQLAEDIGAALAKTELRWRPVPWNGTPLRFGLNQIDGQLVLDAWSTDTGLLPRAELESVLLAVERLLVAAADDDLDAARIPAAIGLEPIVRDENWLMVDASWVDLAEVRRLVLETLGVARVFVSDGSFVAYLVATESVRTPEEAHDRCMAALTAYPTAITPHRYVVCATAPAELDDPAAWPTPLASGTGRIPLTGSSSSASSAPR